MIDFDMLKSEALGIGYEIGLVEMEKLDVYAELLVSYNEKVNLTAIVDPTEIVLKHFVDSMTVLKHIKAGDSLADIGTGAGFPGMVAAILCPDIHVALIDSLKKRLKFLEIVAETFNIKTEIVHARAEDAANSILFRCKFDIVTARAVAALPKLIELCVPFCKIGGTFLAMKGPNIDVEISASDNALRLLGAKLRTAEYFQIGSGAEKFERNIVIIDKIRRTDDKYPRNSAIISKNPL